MKNILQFKEVSKDNIPLVGGKGANLGEMYNSGFPVPNGFIISANAYKKFMDYHNLQIRIDEILKETDVEDSEQLSNSAQKIQNLILESKMPDELAKEIKKTYDIMDVRPEVLISQKTFDFIKSGRDPAYVAVRSSATAEDLPQASFAGQQATYLNVRGADNVVQAVHQCWASLYTPRAIYYREKNNFEHSKVLIAVIIQKMVESDKAGVMFTINPATNNKEEIVIEAAFGLGETVVSGAITPNEYVLNKSDLKIKQRKINQQDWMLTRDIITGRNIKKPLYEKGKSQVLSDEEAKALGYLAKKLEEHYEKPQDIEFAIERKNVYIVQTRPVTTQEKVEESKVESVQGGNLILEGIAASPGVGTGTVKIIEDLNDLTKIQRGDVLVTKMTNPDMVPTMKKAVAIVTDEGGLTSHAAIVSREMGIPAVVGTRKATATLKEDMVVTVDGTSGKVYEGKADIEFDDEEKTEFITIEDNFDTPETITKIKTITDLPEYAEKAAETDADGVGLVRLEFMIANGGVWPDEFIKQGRAEDYIKLLYEGIGGIARAFKDKPVWIRNSDMRTDEYNTLKGAENQPKETDPMIGWHAIRRLLDQPEVLKAEFEAIKRLHDEGLKNIGIMLPFVINVDEVKKAKDILREVGLEPREDIQFGVMIETPASCLIIEDLCEEGIDFISFGTNDLTQLTLGIDRNNSRIQKIFDEMHPAVLKEIKRVIKICKKYGVETSICGQAGSRPEMAKFLVKLGIDSISVNTDSVYKIRRLVATEEKRLMLEAARR